MNPDDEQQPAPLPEVAPAADASADTPADAPVEVPLGLHAAAAEVAATTDAPPPPKFNIHPILVLLALGLTGVIVARGLPFAGDNPEHIGRVIGRGVGALAGIFLLAAGAWRVCGRSAVAGNLAFVLLALAYFGFGLNSLQSARANSDQASHVDRPTEVLRRELRAQAQSGDGLAANPTVRSTEKHAATPDQADDTTQGADPRIARVVSDMSSQDAAMVKRYSEALGRLTAAGAADPATLASRKEVDARLALLRDLNKANDAMAAHARARRAKYRAAMLKEGFTEQETGQFLNQTVPNSTTQLTLAIRKADTDIFAAMRARLEVLRDTMGHWHADAGAPNVYFDESIPGATLDKYSELGERLQAAGARQQELQRTLARHAGPK